MAFFKKELIYRVRMHGIIEGNDFFNETSHCVDFCIASYYENGQSASGTSSIAFELGQKLITSRTSTFEEHQKYWPNSFEMFDIGNWIELRDKILYFSKEKEINLQKQLNKYTPENLGVLYHDKYHHLISQEYEFNVIRKNISSFKDEKKKNLFKKIFKKLK